MTVYINGTTGYSGPVGTIGDLTTTGNTTLGDASSDTLTLNGNTASVPNGLSFTNGNVGIGATPSAWGSVMRALQLGTGGSIFNWTGSNGTVSVGANMYDNGGGVQKYINTAPAGRLDINGNSFAWNIAGSGTAGNTISWTQALTLDASGQLGIGTTTPAAKLDVLSSVNRAAVITTSAAGSYGTLQIVNTTNTYEASIGYRDSADTDATSWVAGKSVNATDAFGWYYGGAKMTLLSTGTLIVGNGTTSSTDTMLLYPASGDALLNLKGGGGYIGLNSTVGGYTHIQGLDNGTLRWRVGQTARGGSDGASIYYGGSNTEAARFASTINMYSPVALNGGMADVYSNSLTGSYTSGTWYALANSGNLGYGVFILVMYVDTYNTGSVYYMQYASVPFYIQNVGSNSGSTFTLPTMFGTGHANNGIDAPPIRIRLTGSGGGIFIDVQANQNWTLDNTFGKTVTYSFKRIA